MMIKRTVTAVIMLVLVLLIYPGCTFLKLRTPASSNPAIASEPLTGNWAMTRVSIEPALPSLIPGLVVNQIFPKTSTWSIGASGGYLYIKYDGKAIWFNSLGIDVAAKPVTPAEAVDKKSCTFSGGGSINEETLPGVLSVIAAAAENPRNISIGYTDQVKITMTSNSQISASITYNVSGTYNSDKGAGNINNSATLTYTGTRK
ncbi:MAG: hypothetical protein JXA01_04825 [Dehalococcoidia bacterium]|nr:hypothetical protein [Dehalococcoidia bacterium]